VADPAATRRHAAPEGSSRGGGGARSAHVAYAIGSAGGFGLTGFVLAPQGDQPDTVARSPVPPSVMLAAPSGQLLFAVNVPPGAPTVYTVMIFPDVAVKEMDRVTVSPAATGTDEGNVNVVVPAAAALAEALDVPLTARLACAVTVLSGSIWTTAESSDATPVGTTKVCDAVPPGIEAALPGLPRHMACPAPPSA